MNTKKDNQINTIVAQPAEEHNLLVHWQTILEMARQTPCLATWLLRQGVDYMRRMLSWLVQLSPDRRMVTSAVVGTAMLFSTLPAIPSKAAATITVTTTNDTVDANGGVCSGLTVASLPGTDTFISLREAICAANTDAGTDTINLPVSGLITLGATAINEDLNATGDLDIRSVIIINGNGTTINGNNNDRVFDLINTGLTDLTLNDVTILNGNSGGLNDGGGINNNNGTLTINNSTISGNTASFRSGGIYNKGTLTINTSTISGNTAFIGGGIYNNGTLTINTSTISGNTAFIGGGINNNNGTLTINNSTISGNTASFKGSGIYNYGVSSGAAQLTINNSTISGNTASSSGGGIYNYGVSSGAAQLTINNSTISGNTASSSGGGIYNYGVSSGAAQLTINNSTISGNTVNSSKGGGISVRLYGTTFLKNSIVAGNTSTSAANNDCYAGAGGSFVSQGYNLVGSTTGCPSGGTGDLTTATPANEINATLANNGGSTFTHALTSVTSQAYEAIPDGTNGCDGAAGTSTSVDQRGAARAQGANKGGSACDIGAYEFNSTQTPTAITLSSLGTRALSTGWGWPLPLAFVGGLGMLVAGWWVRLRRW